MPFSVKKIKGIDTSNLQKLGDSVVDLAKYVEDEFSQVASALQGTDPDHVWNAPLPKPRRGTTIYADGTHWNPSKGEGPYWFDGTTYHPMGQGAIFDAPSDGNIYGRQNALWALVPAAAVVVKTVKVQKFTANGTYTPSAGMLYCIIECVGGGGGGGGIAFINTTTGGGSGSGAAGGYSRLLASAATIGASQTVTVGAGGAGGAAGANNGVAGGDSSVGVLCVAKGGGLGATGTFSAGGAGNGGGTGDIVVAGNSGQGGYVQGSNAISVTQTRGGAGPFGGQAVAFSTGTAGNYAGNPGVGYGAGGNGASTFAASSGSVAGGSGAAGIVFITEYCSQ